MRLRGISPTPICFIRDPSAVIDALYVPMLVASSKAADELSVAAVTRGIENPKQRTSRIYLKIGAADITMIFIYAAALAIAMIVG
jgi:energy-coupling factor transport system permease protein